MEINSYIIDSYEAFQQLKEHTRPFSCVALDTETNHRKERLAKLWGIGLCFEESEAFYIPWRDKAGNKLWTEEQELEIAKWLVIIAQNQKMIMHNGVYDILVLKYNLQIDLTDLLYCDTILLKHTLDEERPHGLKEASVKYLGPWADKAQEALKENIKANGGSVTKDNMEMYKADTEVLGEYCAWDSCLTLRLFNFFEPKLKEQGLWDLFYRDEVMPLYREVTIPMKDHGFPVDVPYFQKLQQEIKIEISSLENEIQKQLHPLVDVFTHELLEKEYPLKDTGNFPKRAAELYKIPLPEKNGKITLAKKEVENYQLANTSINQLFFSWLLGQDKFPFSEKQVQNYSFFKDNPDQKYIFNLKSNKHLQYLFFDQLKENPLSHTDGGDPQVDDDFLESIKDKHEFVKLLIDYKKLNKLESTYISGILEEQIESIIYTSMKQFGTSSGRFASFSPNLQNLPKSKEDDDNSVSPLVLKYVNSIRKGFIPPKDYVIVDADQASLEPRCFAEACGDFLLKDVFIKGEDLYGSIACRIFNLDCTANEVKDKHPKYRTICKVVALAVVYGAEAGRISKVLKCSYQEAEEIINMYLESYPGLVKYMEECDKQVCMTGMIKTKFGRFRHLPKAKEIFRKYGKKLLDRRWSKNNGLGELRYEFKHMLNLAKNHPIQGLAGHIMNRSAINIARAYKKQNLRAYIALQIHDQLITLAHKDDALKAKAITKDFMENSVKLSIPLVAEPKIANNLMESH